MKQVQVPNYSRQALKVLTESANTGHLSEGLAPFVYDMVEGLASAEKFFLPPNGSLLFDPDYKSIDENRVLRLPFPSITLEYEMDPEAVRNDPTYSDEARKNPPSHTKSVLLAIESIRDGEPLIFIYGFSYHPVTKWSFSAPTIINATRYIERNSDGSIHNLIHGSIDNPELQPSKDVAFATMFTLLSFLNVLACSNVGTTRIPARKQPSKKKKNALPFSDYHVLTVGGPRKEGGDQEDLDEHGTHRPPREHLRRGHIRRCASGACVWVNACVVNAGRGGRINKDYDMRG